MADDHSKTKDELPQRPRGGHPYRTAELPPLPRNTRSRRRILRVRGWLVAVAAVAAFAATACQPAQGPAGKVIDRDKTYWSATKQWTYRLTVRKPDGAEVDFRVKRAVYRSCSEGAAYPRCAS
jgi:hypothetical protein